MSKKIIIILISLLTFIVACLIGVLVFCLVNGFNFSFLFSSEYKKVVFDESYENSFNNIIIDSQVANIHIEETIDDNIRVEITGKDSEEYLKKIEVTDEDNALTIKLKDKNRSFFSFNTKCSRINIYIPKNYDQKINIKTDVGNIYVGNFAKLNIKVSSNTGNIYIDKARNIQASCDMGNIKITNALNYVDIKNNMGNIKISNLNISKDSKIKNDMGNITIKKTNDIYIDAKTSMGNTKVKKNNRKSDITLLVRNDMGNIKINN